MDKPLFIPLMPDSGFKIVPHAPTEAWIMALDDRHIVNDQSSPGGGKLAQMIERVIATAPTYS